MQKIKKRLAAIVSLPTGVLVVWCSLAILFLCTFTLVLFFGCGGKKGTPTQPSPLTSISISSTKITLNIGETIQFTATGTYSDGSTVNITSQVTWSSSNTSVGTISLSGLFTAIAQGTTNITATKDGITSDSVTITVSTHPSDNVWQKTYGGSGYDVAYSIQQTSDGGYIVAGWTDSFGAGYEEFYIIKLDASGSKLWEKTYGGSNNDGAYSIQQTSD